MAEFAYRNAIIATTSDISFKLNYDYHLRVSYKKDVNLCAKLRFADKVVIALHKPIHIYKNNLQYIQKPKKQFHIKHVKPWNNVPYQKVWLNTKYIQTK